MKRQRFIVTAISAAAVGAAFATDACSPVGRGSSVLAPGSDLLPAGEVNALTVRYVTTSFGGGKYKLHGRTYDGKTVGPTIVTRPGETLTMRVINDLPPEPPAKPPEGRVEVPIVHDAMQAMDPRYDGPMRPSVYIDPNNNPHGFNTTNMHVHGIQTLPHLFYPLGTSDPQAPMIEVKPGQRFTYNFPIPADHPSGLHWYHPHKHGSTDVQVSNGMAGLIVVRGPIDEVPEIKAAREFFVVVQTLNVNPSKKYPGEYDREYVAYKDPKNGGYRFGTDYTMITVNGIGTYWADNTVTGPAKLTPVDPVPQFQVQPGEVVRLRLLNGCNALPLFLALPEFTVYQIGFDGVNTLKPIWKDMSGTGVSLITPQNLFKSPVRVAMHGNRIELLLQAPSQTGSYMLSTVASSGINFQKPAMNLAEFVVSGPPVTMGIPGSLPVPTREYPVISQGDIVKYRKFVFDQGERSDLLTGFGFTINNELYQMMECPTQPKVGTCEEWLIENATTDAHPFHLHENSFQLIEINGEPNDMEVWDTFIIPPKVGNTNGSIRIRVRFVQWTGKTVFHCHILPHEDTGMMQNILMT